MTNGTCSLVCTGNMCTVRSLQTPPGYSYNRESLSTSKAHSMVGYVLMIDQVILQ